ncbi:MAG: hypothetical protein NC293_10120 [Roseburia sp.]|nr:hypothetical protein [Roseburia sp.]
MFVDTVTVFNFFEDQESGECRWYPKVLHGVELQTAKGIVADTKGVDTADKASLHIPYSGNMTVCGYDYRKPLAWQAYDDKTQCITIAENDFFVEGAFDLAVVDEADYPEGFYEHMRASYDDVYNITSVNRYDTIPHFEVGGR